MAKKLKRPSAVPLVFAPTSTGKKAESAYKASHEPAGPYRNQSSVPSIRKKATPAEHRVPSPSTSASKRPSSASTDVFTVPSLPKAIARKSKRLEHETARKVAKLRALDVLKNNVEDRTARGLRILRTTKLPKLPLDPAVIQMEAKAGIAPPKAEQAKFPKRYEKAKLSELRTKEGLKEDPLAELAISTAATAGLGTVAKLAATGAEAGGAALLARGGSQIASKEATVAESAAEHGVKALAAKSAKVKPAGASGGGSRVAARSTARPARSLVAKERVRIAKAGKRVRKHPVRYTGGAQAVAPVGGVNTDLSKRANAFVTGSGNALIHHPTETLETTGRSLAGAITGPAALLGAGVSSIKHGTPEPLEKTAKEQVQGVAKIVGNAFSGDAKTAEKAARTEGSLALATPLPAITRLAKYEKGRGVLRETAAKGRRKLAKRSEKLNRNVRHAPEGVEQHVSGVLGRHEHRKQTALLKQRVDNPLRVKRAHHEAAIAHAIAKSPDAHVALQVLAEYGVRGPDGARRLRHDGPGDKQLLTALDYVDAHPQVWKDKNVERALTATDRASKGAPAALVGKGERARLLPQGDLLGIQRPEHMSPTNHASREAAWDDLHQRDLQLKALKRQGREKFNQAKVLKGLEAKRTLEEGKAFYAQARKLQKDNKALYDALSPYTHPEHSIDQSKRMVYDDKMLSEYKRQVEAARKQAGLAPAIWTHHGPVDQAGSGMVGAYSKAPGVEHMREGALAQGDNLDRSLEGLIRGTVHLPRQRAAAREFVRSLANHFKTPFTIDGKQKFVGQGSRDWNEITKQGGQFDPKSWGRLSYREWKNALKDPYLTEAERASKLQSLLADAESGKVKGHEPWILMPREAIKEAKAQVNPEQGGVTSLFNTFGRTANRLILGTNPAWEVAQVVAEGIPILLSHPELLNPAKLASIEKDIWKYRKQNPEKALELQAMAGATPISGAALRTPGDMQETYTPVQWADGAKELTRGKTAREALGFAKLRTLGKIDALRQNEYRTVLMAAEADKRFRGWHSSLAGLFDSQARLSRQFKGKSRAELWDWLQHDPKGKAERVKLEDYVDNVAGNFTSFSRYERDFAPLVIFYGFLRYSIRWSTWAFPKTHPIMATMAYMLAQANANQIDKLTGEGLHEAGLQKTNAPAKPSNPLAYAFPVYEGTGGNRSVLPGGSRISPGQSSLTQALSSGNPAAVLSSANPFLGAGIEGLTGVESFTGEKTTKPQGWAALEQLTGLSYPARAKLPILGLDKESLSEKALGALGAPPRGPASKAYEALDKNKNIRQGIYPGAPQTGRDFGRTEALSKSFDLKYGKGHLPSILDSRAAQEVLFSGKDGTKVDWTGLKRLIDEAHKSELGKEKVSAAEGPFYPASSGGFSKEQSKALQMLEDAWKTGPSGKPRKVKRGGIGGSSGGIGGPSGASIGGPAGGGIGGPNGISIGGP
jgi:hypothetical protein